MAMKYNDPAGGTPSSIGKQNRIDYYDKVALIEAAKERHYTQMADTRAMPKHMGKEIVKDLYVPVLDDANINDQGIDANGASSTVEVTIVIKAPDVVSSELWNTVYAVGEGTNQTTALAAAKTKAEDLFKELGVFDTDYATTKANLTGLADPWVVDDTSVNVPASGNLYGSSKDVGTIQGRLPTLTENGGRVNRIGFTRVTRRSNLNKYGMFYDYTKEDLDFDSDPQKEVHVRSELLKAGMELMEDISQIEILNNAGVVRYAGAAVSRDTLSGEQGAVTVPTYMDFVRLAISLVNNRVPLQTKILKGSDLMDTRTVDDGYIMFVGSETIPIFEQMVDLHGQPAFKSKETYAAGTKLMRGEIGAVHRFRIIVVQEQMHWEGQGAVVSNNSGYYETGGKYDVFPMVVVGQGSYTHIGFEGTGGKNKFKVKHVKPESDISYSELDPFGEKGWGSLKFYEGVMILRPERIALLLTVAPY